MKLQLKKIKITKLDYDKLITIKGGTNTNSDGNVKSELQGPGCTNVDPSSIIPTTDI